MSPGSPACLAASRTATAEPMTGISAITLLVSDMARSVRFYEDLGLTVAHGGRSASFTSLRIGADFVNLSAGEGPPGGFWGRVVFHVDDPDAVHTQAVEAGHRPEFDPRDAPWNERYFHIRDPDGHRIELYCSDYQTVDPEHEPIRWDLKDPQRQTLWGAPAPRSWFEEGTFFAGVDVRDAELKAQPIVAP